MSVIDVPYGERIQRRTGVRKCKMCGTKLNSYNYNDYCHAHALKGASLDQHKRAEMAALSSKAYAHRKAKHK